MGFSSFESPVRGSIPDRPTVRPRAHSIGRGSLFHAETHLEPELDALARLTALWRARFASGLLHPSYTINRDTTHPCNQPAKLRAVARRGKGAHRGLSAPRHPGLTPSTSPSELVSAATKTRPFRISIAETEANAAGRARGGAGLVRPSPAERTHSRAGRLALLNESFNHW